MVLPQRGELRNFALLEDVHEKQEARVRYCEFKLQKIVLAYLVWGRLFFFGIVKASNSSFECKDWWIVLALTLSCTFPYSLLFMNAVIVLSQNQDHLDIICNELTEICQQILVAENVEAGVFSDGFQLIFRVKMFMLDHSRSRSIVGTGRKVYVFFIGCALLALTAIELYACRCLLCN